MRNNTEPLKRLTPQRAEILRLLEASTTHPSAEGIYREARKNFPHLSFATVYNTLEALTSLGHIRKLTMDPERRRYDPDTTSHHHLICTSCRRVVDIHERFHLSVPRDQARGFTVDYKYIEFYGLCPECRKKGAH